jgi:hypothetical protein
MAVAKKAEIPLFSKEGLGEIYSVWLKNPPQSPFAKGGGFITVTGCWLSGVEALFTRILFLFE